MLPLRPETGFRLNVTRGKNVIIEGFLLFIFNDEACSGFVLSHAISAFAMYTYNEQGVLLTRCLAWDFATDRPPKSTPQVKRHAIMYPYLVFGCCGCVLLLPPPLSATRI